VRNIGYQKYLRSRRPRSFIIAQSLKLSKHDASKARVLQDGRSKIMFRSGGNIEDSPNSPDGHKSEA